MVVRSRVSLVLSLSVLAFSCTSSSSSSTSDVQDTQSGIDNGIPTDPGQDAVADVREDSGPGSDLAQADPGAGDPGSSDPGAVDPGPTDPGASDPGAVDPGPTDPGPTDPGPTDPGPTDPGTPPAFACPGNTCSPSGQGLTMRPGQDCTGCHGFAYAGTVYGPAGDKCGNSNQGVDGVVVDAIPAGGGTAVNLGTTNCVGNFATSGGPSGMVHFRVTYQAGGNTWTKTMSTDVDGSGGVGCASCHTSGGSAGAPIHL